MWLISTAQLINMRVLQAVESIPFQQDVVFFLNQVLIHAPSFMIQSALLLVARNQWLNIAPKRMLRQLISHHVASSAHCWLLLIVPFTLSDRFGWQTQHAQSFHLATSTPDSSIRETVFPSPWFVRIQAKEDGFTLNLTSGGVVFAAICMRCTFTL